MRLQYWCYNDATHHVTVFYQVQFDNATRNLTKVTIKIHRPYITGFYTVKSNIKTNKIYEHYFEIVKNCSFKQSSQTILTYFKIS